jgi:benzoate-CoA ligase
VNLVEYVFRAARNSDGWARPAILYEDQRLTYEELFRLVKKFAGAIRAKGFMRGDVVVIAAADCPEFVISFLGTIAAGSVAVPVSVMSSPAELEHILNHCGARAVVITSDQLDKLQSIRGNLHRLETVLLVDGESEGARSFGDVLACADELNVEPVGEDATAFILYTSGSTGRPKGAVHVHRNLPATVETFCRRVLRVEPEDRLFSSSRLFFAYGLGNSLSFPLGSCAASILCKERPTPQAIAEVFEKYRPTIFFGVPAVFRALLEHVSRGAVLETGSLKFCVSAGERLPRRIFREWKELTGLDILDGIGSTEMLHMFIANSREEIRVGSSGRVVPGYEVKLTDASGREVEGEGTGDLWVKGPSACKGYLKEPEKTAATMLDGWVRTGDLYRRDDEDHYWFEGRADDLFKVKGMWVSPVEVEDALLSCAEVLEAAVVPMIDSNGLSSAVAYVVLKSKQPGGADVEEKLHTHLSSRLPPYKRPAEFRFADALPRTATGKLQRFKLRDELAKF